MILVKNRQLLFSNNEQRIGTSYDNGSTNRAFRVDRINEDGFDMSTLIFRINLHYMDTDTTDTDILDTTITDRHIDLTWNIPDTVTAHEGAIKVQLRAFDETGIQKWSTYQSVIHVEGVLGVEPSEEGLTMLEKLDADVRSKLNTLTASEEGRASAEEKRVQAEVSRESVEDERDEAETLREAAELERVKAEKQREESFDEKSLLAKSYAVGGTGVREGEDTDNAKYYAEQAEATKTGAIFTDGSTAYFGTEEKNPTIADAAEEIDAIAAIKEGIRKRYKLKDETARNAAKAGAIDVTDTSGAFGGSAGASHKLQASMDSIGTFIKTEAVTGAVLLYDPDTESVSLSVTKGRQ